MPRTDEPRYGPAMLALPNDRWRTAVEAYVRNPRGDVNDKGYVAAVRVAGFQGTPNSLRVTAHRMFRDDRVQRAIVEQMRRTIVSDVPVAHDVMVGIMLNPAHPMQFAAAKVIHDKGIPAQLEIEHRHEHTIAPEMMSRAIQIARTIGKPVEELLGWKLAAQLPAPQPIDVEFTEVLPEHRIPEGGW